MSKFTTGWQSDPNNINNRLMKNDEGLVIALVDVSVGGFQAADTRSRYVGWKTFHRLADQPRVHRHGGIVTVLEGLRTFEDAIAVALQRAETDIRNNMPDLEWRDADQE